MISLLFKSSVVANGILLVACTGLWFFAGNLSSKNKKLSESLETANSTISKHEENKIVTERTSNDLQKNLDAVIARYDRLLKQPIQCHPVTSHSGGNNGAAVSERLPEGNGVRSDWGRLFARNAETDARRLAACQSFIRMTWKINN